MQPPNNIVSRVAYGFAQASDSLDGCFVPLPCIGEGFGLGRCVALVAEENVVVGV